MKITVKNYYFIFTGPKTWQVFDKCMLTYEIIQF